MEHFITNIHIDQVRHLKDIDIPLDQKQKRHLILTGKNGSGKTSVLEAIKAILLGISEEIRNKATAEYPRRMKAYEEYILKRVENHLSSELSDMQQKKTLKLLDKEVQEHLCGINIMFSKEYEIEEYCQNGSFLTAFFPADRQTKLEIPKGVEEVALEKNYSVEQYPVEKLLKYMVHLKTQQAYAKNENDAGTEELVREWFSIFEEAIRKLMDDSSVFMEYDYRNYNFQIHQDGRNPYGFNELSDGYSAAIYILADLLMRMDQNWLLNGTSLDTSMEGVVLIDEVETHLHLELQRTMLPFLTEMFPNLQFIVTTHSPFVVNSLQDAVVYDLENKILVRDGLSSYSYSGIVEGYFRADELSETLRKKFTRYKELTQKQALTDEEYDEIMGLEQYLDEIPDYLSLGIATEYKKMKLEFEQREDAE